MISGGSSPPAAGEVSQPISEVAIAAPVQHAEYTPPVQNAQYSPPERQPEYSAAQLHQLLSGGMQHAEYTPPAQTTQYTPSVQPISEVAISAPVENAGYTPPVQQTQNSRAPPLYNFKKADDDIMAMISGGSSPSGAGEVSQPAYPDVKPIAVPTIANYTIHSISATYI